MDRLQSVIVLIGIILILTGGVVVVVVEHRHRQDLHDKMIKSFDEGFETASDKKGRYIRDNGPERLLKLEKDVSELKEQSKEK